MLVISTKIKSLLDQKFGADASTFIKEEENDDYCFYWLFCDDNKQNSDLYICCKNEDYLNKQTALSPVKKYEILMFLSDYMDVVVGVKKTKEQLSGMMFYFYNSEIDG